ncbi:MAG: hypothetical protein FWC09_10965 [Lachnospiraceae bacterium]|nr:hypothetical protein [Lachnospiraceae bacterium]
MDNFIDRITHRFSGHEVIKANAEAEAAEMRMLKGQAEQAQKTLMQYDTCLQDMRKLNLRNSESAEAVQDLIDNAQAILVSCQNKIDELSLNETAITDLSQKITSINEQILEKLGAFEKTIAEQNSALNEVRDATQKNSEAITASQNIRHDLKGDLEETVHKENVKVYRNVQAILMEEVSKQTQALTDDSKGIKGVNKAVLTLVIISLAVGLGNLTVIVLQLLGIF